MNAATIPPPDCAVPPAEPVDLAPLRARQRAMSDVELRAELSNVLPYVFWRRAGLPADSDDGARWEEATRAVSATADVGGKPFRQAVSDLLDLAAEDPRRARRLARGVDALAALTADRDLAAGEPAPLRHAARHTGLDQDEMRQAARTARAQGLLTPRNRIAAPATPARPPRGPLSPPASYLRRLLGAAAGPASAGLTVTPQLAADILPPWATDTMRPRITAMLDELTAHGVLVRLPSGGAFRLTPRQAEGALEDLRKIDPRDEGGVLPALLAALSSRLAPTISALPVVPTAPGWPPLAQAARHTALLLDELEAVAETIGHCLTTGTGHCDPAGTTRLATGIAHLAEHRTVPAARRILSHGVIAASPTYNPGAALRLLLALARLEWRSGNSDQATAWVLMAADYRSDTDPDGRHLYAIQHARTLSDHHARHTLAQVAGRASPATAATARLDLAALENLAAPDGAAADTHAQRVLEQPQPPLIALRAHLLLASSNGRSDQSRHASTAREIARELGTPTPIP